jgi:hypothetical protein
MANPIPRWPDRAGRIFRSSDAADAPVIFSEGNSVLSFDDADFYGYIASAYGDPSLAPAPSFRAGDFGRPGFLIRPPRGVLFIDGVSLPGVNDATIAADAAAYEALAAGLELALDGSGVAMARGMMNAAIPAEAFGNAYFPDGYDVRNFAGGYASGTPLAAGDTYNLGWLWAVTQGWPGDPALIQGGDLLVFVVAYCDDTSAVNTTGDPAVTPKASYHDGVFYYGSAFEASVAQPTAKYLAHYNRFVSLVGRLQRFRCVVLRNSGYGTQYNSSGEAARAESHVSAQFHGAIEGLGGYAGMALADRGFELMEGGVPSLADLKAIVNEQFGLAI